MAEISRRQQNKTIADSHFITLNGRGKSCLSGPLWQVLERPCRTQSVAPCPQSCYFREKYVKHPDRQAGLCKLAWGGVCWEKWEWLFKMSSVEWAIFTDTCYFRLFHWWNNWSVIGEILGTSTFEWHRNWMEKPECLWGQFSLFWVQVFIQGAEWQSGQHRTGLLGL